MTNPDPISCPDCGSAPIQIHHVRMAERDGRAGIVLGVPIWECLGCGTIWIEDEVRDHSNRMIHRLLDSGAESATGRYEAVLAYLDG